MTTEHTSISRIDCQQLIQADWKIQSLVENGNCSVCSAKFTKHAFLLEEKNDGRLIIVTKGCFQKAIKTCDDSGKRDALNAFVHAYGKCKRIFNNLRNGHEFYLSRDMLSHVRKANLITDEEDSYYRNFATDRIARKKLADVSIELINKKIVAAWFSPYEYQITQRNNLTNRELEEKPTPSKTNSPGCFAINTQVEIPSPQTPALRNLFSPIVGNSPRSPRKRLLNANFEPDGHCNITVKVKKTSVRSLFKETAQEGRLDTRLDPELVRAAELMSESVNEEFDAQIEKCIKKGWERASPS